MSTTVATSFDVVLVVMVVVLGAVLAVMPDLTRPSLYFAVTVDPEFRRGSEGRRARSLYRATVVAGTLLAAALALALRPSGHPTLASIGPMVLVGSVLGGYFIARRIVLPHSRPPDAVREAGVLHRRGSSMPGGWLLQSVPFIALAAVAAVLAVRWDDIADRIPAHWGVNGSPDAWAARSTWSVLGPIVNGLVACGLLLLVGWGIARWTRQLAASGPEAAREGRFRRLVLSVILASEIVLAAVSGWVALLPLLDQRASRLLPLVVPGITVLGVIAIVFCILRFGQGGSRLADPTGGCDGGTTGIGDRSDDRHWRAGLLYFNPADPTLFVEKRFGVGYTVNFGSPWAWALLALVVLVPVLLSAL